MAPASHELKNRDAFYNKAEDVLRTRGIEDPADFLRGLK